jgi:hypothetical protein
MKIYAFKSTTPGLTEAFNFDLSMLPAAENPSVAYCYYRRVLPPGTDVLGTPPEMDNLVCILMKGELVLSWGKDYEHSAQVKTGDLVFVQDAGGNRRVTNTSNADAVIMYFRVGGFGESYQSADHRPPALRPTPKP